MLKVLLTVGLYLSVVFVLGYVLAMLAPREAVERELDDEET
jgi:hypothetical protein